MFIRARQRAVTAMTPQQANSGAMVPSRKRPVVDVVPAPVAVGTIPAQVGAVGVAFTPLVLGGFFANETTIALGVAGLPPGLSLGGGVVTGTPLFVGVHPVVFLGQNAHGMAEQAASFTIS